MARTPHPRRCGCCHITSGRALVWCIRDATGAIVGWCVVANTFPVSYPLQVALIHQLSSEVVRSPSVSLLQLCKDMSAWQEIAAVSMPTSLTCKESALAAISGISANELHLRPASHVQGNCPYSSNQGRAIPHGLWQHWLECSQKPDSQRGPVLPALNATSKRDSLLLSLLCIVL